MIILHFDLQPQFKYMNYFIYTSHHKEKCCSPSVGPREVRWWYGTLKYGDFHEKLNFLKMQDLRPLNTCRKHVEMILPNFPLDECEI